MDSLNYYELLDVQRDATTEQVRDAYVRLAKRVHPDSGGSPALFRQVEEAYRVLSSPVERKRYDRDLASGARSSGGPTTGSGNGYGGYGGYSARPRYGPQPPTPKDIADAVIHGGTKWVKDVTDKRTERRTAEERKLQEAWPKTLGLDFLRIELKAWRPILSAAVVGQTRCSVSWARKDVVEPPLQLHAIRVDPGSPPHLLVWKVEGAEGEWMSWRVANADGTFVELYMRIDSSPGCRPKWARRHIPAGTHLVVDNWIP